MHTARACALDIELEYEACPRGSHRHATTTLPTATTRLPTSTPPPPPPHPHLRQVLLEVDLGHYRHEYGVWSNMSVQVEGYDASPACTGMDACAADSTTFEHGAAAALSVWHGRRNLANQLPLYAYAPDVNWQFALGERTCLYCAHTAHMPRSSPPQKQCPRRTVRRLPPAADVRRLLSRGAGGSTDSRGDAMRIDSLRMRSGELMTETVVPLSVSVNGRDFKAVPGGFGYYTPPAASAVSPAVGPAAGSTSLVVTGYAIGADYGTQLECMLGGLVVEATRLNHSAVRCTSPNVRGGPIEPPARVAQLNLAGSLGSLIPSRSYRLT